MRDFSARGESNASTACSLFTTTERQKNCLQDDADRHPILEKASILRVFLPPSSSFLASFLFYRPLNEAKHRTSFGENMFLVPVLGRLLSP